MCTAFVYQLGGLGLRGTNKKPLNPCGIRGLDVLVPRDGIEPPTRGFSIPCSTD